MFRALQKSSVPQLFFGALQPPGTQPRTTARTLRHSILSLLSLCQVCQTLYHSVWYIKKEKKKKGRRQHSPHLQSWRRKKTEKKKNRKKERLRDFHRNTRKQVHVSDYIKPNENHHSYMIPWIKTVPSTKWRSALKHIWRPLFWFRSFSSSANGSSPILKHASYTVMKFWPRAVTARRLWFSSINTTNGNVLRARKSQTVNGQGSNKMRHNR